MNDIAAKLWSAYRCDDLQPEHPIRRAIDEIRALRLEVSRLQDEAARAWAIAREHGQQRDALGRELVEAHAYIESSVRQCLPYRPSDALERAALDGYGSRSRSDDPWEAHRDGIYGAVQAVLDALPLEIADALINTSLAGQHAEGAKP